MPFQFGKPPQQDVVKTIERLAARGELTMHHSKISGWMMSWEYGSTEIHKDGIRLRSKGRRFYDALAALDQKVTPIISAIGSS